MGDLDVVAVVRAMGWDAQVYGDGPDYGELAGRLALVTPERAIEWTMSLAPVPVFVPEEISELVDATHYPATTRLSPLETAVLQAVVFDDTRKLRIA